MYKYLILTLLVVSLAPVAINAQVKIENPLRQSGVNTVWDLLSKVIDFIFYISMPIGAIMIIVAGYYFVTAMGQPEKILTAKKMIIWTLIGLLIIISSKGIISLFADIFDINTGFNGNVQNQNNDTNSILRVLNPFRWFR